MRETFKVGDHVTWNSEATASPDAPRHALLPLG
jgi:hypothetical protein